MRIGQGYDVHKLVEGRKLILGGVGIPYEKGLLGHSDADVLVHAVMDALLGASILSAKRTFMHEERMMQLCALMSPKRFHGVVPKPAILKYTDEFGTVRFHYKIVNFLTNY